MTLTAPRKLTRQDDVRDFDCGSLEISNWLSDYALVSQQAGMATVFVTTRESRVVGYYALTMGAVQHQDAPERISKRQPRYPIPVTILARLGVDLSCQHQGVGRALLIDALRRVAAAADEIGCRALLIHAKDDGARRYYLELAEFEPSPTDDLHLYLLMKDLRALTA